MPTKRSSQVKQRRCACQSDDGLGAVVAYACNQDRAAATFEERLRMLNGRCREAAGDGTTERIYVGFGDRPVGGIQ